MLLDFRVAADTHLMVAARKPLSSSTSHPSMVVPAGEVHLYKRDLPEIKLHIFEDRGHFNQESFPEIIKLIKAMD